MTFVISCTGPVGPVTFTRHTAWEALTKAYELRGNATLLNVQVRDEDGDVVEIAQLALRAAQEGR